MRTQQQKTGRAPGAIAVLLSSLLMLQPSLYAQNVHDLSGEIFTQNIAADVNERLYALRAAIIQLYGEEVAQELTVVRDSTDQPVPLVDFNGEMQRIHRTQNIIIAPSTNSDVVAGVQFGKVGPTAVQITFFVPKAGLTKDVLLSQVKDLLAEQGGDIAFISSDESDTSSWAWNQSQILVNEKETAVIALNDNWSMVTFSLFYDAGNLTAGALDTCSEKVQTVQGSLQEPSKRPRPKLKQKHVIGLNGVGRTGKAALVSALRSCDPEYLQFVVQRYEAKKLRSLLVLPDETHGRFFDSRDIEGPFVDEMGEYLLVHIKEDLMGEKWVHKLYAFRQEGPFENLPWAKYGVEAVLETTGTVKTARDLQKHIQAGAKCVLLSQPSDGNAEASIVLGVNDRDLPKVATYDCASCTTNNVAPAIEGITQLTLDGGSYLGANVLTVHSYTNTQNLFRGTDTQGKGAAAPQVISQASTGAGKALGPVMKAAGRSADYKNTISALALRVSAPDGSVTITRHVIQLPSGQFLTAEDVNNHFIQLSKGQMKGVLAVEAGVISAAQIIGRSESSILLADATKVRELIPGSGVFIVTTATWYDNEWGYSTRLIDLLYEILSLRES